MGMDTKLGNLEIISYDCGCSKERVTFPELPESFLSPKKKISYGWKWRNCEFHICIVKEEPNRKKKKEILEKIEKSQKLKS